MRALSTLSLIGLVVPVAAPVFAQSAGSITIDHPWAPATPNGARTGAVYLTVKNATSSKDRLIGGSSQVASEVQIHGMKIAGGVMHMRELPRGLEIHARAQ